MSALARRKVITIDPTKVSGDQTAFPVWLVLDDADLASRALPDGSDIYFTRTDGSPVSFERVRWTSGTGHLEAWVKLDLADTTLTVFELRYGDASLAAAPDAAMTFSNSFAAVWHLDDTLATTAVADARGQHPGTAVGAMTTSASVNGKLGRAFDFDGIDDEVSFTNMLTGNTSHTISAWIDVAAPTTGFGSIFCVGNAMGASSRWWHSDFGGSNLSVGFYGPDFPDSDSVTDSAFHLVHWVWDAATLTSTVYVDATQTDNDVTAMTPNTTGTGGHIGNAPIAWGPGGNTPNPINGLMDEIRIATVPRSLGWIQTERANQGSPATFYSIGVEQPLP